MGGGLGDGVGCARNRALAPKETIQHIQLNPADEGAPFPALVFMHKISLYSPACTLHLVLLFCISAHHAICPLPV